MDNAKLFSDSNVLTRCFTSQQFNPKVIGTDASDAPQYNELTFKIYVRVDRLTFVTVFRVLLCNSNVVFFNLMMKMNWAGGGGGDLNINLN